MSNRFLLGPAGSGKTWRCLQEVRAILEAEPVGPPLLFVTPRQATYQVERQLLEFGRLKAFARLHIVSLEGLGSFLLGSLQEPIPQVIGEHGRAMLTRAACSSLGSQLKAYGPASCRSGFAAEIAGILSEFRARDISPAAMRKLAGKSLVRGVLASKLLDLATIEEQLMARIAGLDLADPAEPARLAAEYLEKLPAKPLFGGVWVDGFAEFAPMEQRLLALLAARSQGMTVAVCLERLFENPPVWHSIWHVPWTGVSDLRSAFEKAGVPDFEITQVAQGNGRFTGSPALAHLERHFGSPAAAAYPGGAPMGSIAVVECGNSEEEAVVAARRIRRHILGGGRFREVAVLSRDLASTHAVFTRVFKRYGIPVFLDRRKPEKHHPLLDLIRSSLRIVTLGWRRADFIAALKTGMLGADMGEVHWFENEAIRRGWDHGVWRAWLQAGSEKVSGWPSRAIPLISEPTRHLARLGFLLSGELDGVRFADSLREFLKSAKARETLLEKGEETPGLNSASTVWDALENWLDEAAAVFKTTSFSASQWLELAEEAFSLFSIGVIPPVLDQVLLGNVDRSRNPDLRMVIITGCNEGIFPARAAVDGLLTESDRQILSQEGCPTGPDPRAALSVERYLGYIAFTRARESLVITYSQRGADGKPLNTSPFLDIVRALFPELEAEPFTAEALVLDCLHPGELTPPPEEPGRPPVLPAETVASLYGTALNGSVSSLERFAACSFRFFAHAGLKAREREEFEVDPRSKGTFLHEILSGLHERIIGTGREWKDISEDEARSIVLEVSALVAPAAMGGVMVSSQLNRLGVELETKRLCDLAATMVAWARETEFAPTLAEFGYGGPEDALRFKLPLEAGRALHLQGRIDRVDVARVGSGRAAVVLDYKSGVTRLNPVLLQHGEQLQLPVYLIVLRDAAMAGGQGMIPAGAFYFRLSQATKKMDRKKLQKPDSKRPAGGAAYEGVYDLAFEALLGEGGFALKLNKDGGARRKSFGPLSTPEFQALLDQSRKLLVRFGDRIFAGDIAVDPSSHGGKVACERCDFAGICRIDRWTHPFRVLTLEQSSEL